MRNCSFSRDIWLEVGRRRRVVLQNSVLRVPYSYIIDVYICYVHMDKWIDLSRSSLSLRTHTSGGTRRLYTLDNARGLTHTHKWHIILYTRPEQCQQFARPLSVQARTRLSKTGKLYDRERGSSAAQATNAAAVAAVEVVYSSSFHNIHLWPCVHAFGPYVVAPAPPTYYYYYYYIIIVIIYYVYTA